MLLLLPNKLVCGAAFDREVVPNTFLLAFSAVGLLPRPLKKPPPPPPPDPNTEEPPNGEDSALEVLTEEKGEGVFAADVWPKMELEEVFPKSDCPPEPPNMLPPRVEVPKPPLP